jgi:integrase
MSEEIKVFVINKGRKNLYLRHIDPMTGRGIEKSAKTSNHKAAIKAAGAWEDELRSGRYQKPVRLSWDVFREHYSTNALPGLAPRTADTYESTLNVFGAKCKPGRLADVTTAWLTSFVTALRAENAAEATIAHHLRHLKAAMRWAHRQGLLIALPQFTMPKRVKGAKVMRGRPITTEEVERMLALVPKAIGARPNTVGVDNVGPWRFYLRGLWQSGLRLTESLTLRWDYAPGAIVVDLDGRRPILRIPAEAEKGNRDRVLPMTPEFAALLASVPEADRHGRVFKLLTASGSPFNVPCEVSRVVTAIGKAANVVVDERQKGRATIRKFASAHDLRRAFAVRWAAKIKPTQLRELMRHASIGTTLAYYVGEDAEATADALWAGFVDTSVDTTGAQNKTEKRQRERLSAITV